MTIGRRSWGAVSGVVAAGVALGVGELAAGATRPEASPVTAVGNAAIDLTPIQVEHWATRTLGTSDRPVLVAGIVVVLGLFAVFTGVAAVRRPEIGVAGVGVLGMLGIAAAVTRPDVRPLDGLPSLLAALAGVGALYLLLWRETAHPADGQPADQPTDDPAHLRPARPVEAATQADRRRFLLTGAAAVGVAATTAAGGRAWQHARFSAQRSRAAVRLPAAADPGPPSVPLARQITVPGVSPFYTPAARFYRVDTALVVPQVKAERWVLRVHGQVDRPLTLTYDQLLARRLMERDVTLTCVSNEVGDPYISNGRWLGAHLGELLDEAGVRRGADQLVCRSADGMTIGAPLAAATDGRDAMLAVGLGGQPLPVEHGFPVRMVIPGLYGYVSACKWLVDIEVSTFGTFDAYWVDRGWAQQAPIKTESRIDTPGNGAELVAGQVAVAGVAWAQHRGIDRVEVQVDDEPWQECQLGGVPSLDTWRQWVYRWQATPGDHQIRVRATDGTRTTQTDRRQDAYPSGATGWHTVFVTVT